VKRPSPGRPATTGTRRLRPFAVPRWKRDVRSSRDVCRRARARRVADETSSAPDRGQTGGGLTSTDRAAPLLLSGQGCRSLR
jgi:hypothetical protein